MQVRVGAELGDGLGDGLDVGLERWTSTAADAAAGAAAVPALQRRPQLRRVRLQPALIGRGVRAGGGRDNDRIRRC